DSQQQGKWLTGQGRVLVMDDEPDILSFSHVVLKRLGYDAELARDGVEALRRYREAAEAGKPFSAVIMDLTIPGGMGGKEAIKRLLEFDPQARAIVSSGYSNDPVMAEFQKHRFRSVVAARGTERGLQSAGVLVSEGGFGILRARLCGPHVPAG